MKFKLKKIEIIERKEYKGNFHDLTVEDDHSYNIDGVIVHNSICSTRINTGFGVPLLSSLENCASIRKSAYILADGGMADGGDIAKAIYFGADMCILGKQFASTDFGAGDCYDGQGNIVCPYNQIDEPYTKERGSTNKEHVLFKRYRGMASAEARKGVLKRSSVEGRSGLIKYKGTTEDFIFDIEENMRASQSYGGVTNWNDFRREVKMARITSSGYFESQTHLDIHD